MIPFFFVWFVLMSVVRSVGDQLFVVKGLGARAFNNVRWELLIDFGLEVSSFCITMALAGVGLEPRFPSSRAGIPSSCAWFLHRGLVGPDRGGHALLLSI